MSLKKWPGKALVYLVLEIGALCGVPMRPDEIEKLLKIADRGVRQVMRNENGRGNDPGSAKTAGHTF